MIIGRRRIPVIESLHLLQAPPIEQEANAVM